MMKLPVILGVIVVVTARPVFADDTPRLDTAGDPLPAGAVARLGSLRWHHANQIGTVAYGNSGKEILTSSGNGVVYVWDAESGKELRHFGEAAKDAGHVIIAVADDGKTVAVSAVFDREIHLWDVESGKERNVIKRFDPAHTKGLFMSPGGKTLAGRDMNSIEIWDTADGKRIREIEVSLPDRWCDMPVVISPDGKWIAGPVILAEGEDHYIFLHVWDTKKEKAIQKIKVEPSVPNGDTLWPAFSPDSQHIAWALADGRIAIYDVAGGKEVRKLGDATPDRRVLCMKYAPDGKALAGLTSDKTIVLLDTATGRKLTEIGEVAPGIHGKAMLEFLRENRPFFNRLDMLAFSPDGKRIAQGWGNVVRQWNAETGKPCNIAAGHAGTVSAVALSADGKTAITAGSDNTVRKWDLATAKQSQVINVTAEADTALLAGPNRAVVRDSAAVHVWDLPNGKEALKLEVHNDVRPILRPGQMSISPDGRSLAVSTPDQVIRVFDLDTGKQRNADKELRFSDKLILQALGISSDASVAVSLSSVPVSSQSPDVFLNLHEGDSGELLWKDYDAPGSLTFSRDGCNLAYICSYSKCDAPVAVLEAITGKKRVRFTMRPATMLAFSADNRFLAVVNAEGIVKVMDIHGGNEIATFEAKDFRSSSVCFSRDGGTLLTGGTDGTTLVWDISAQVQKARSRAEIDADTCKHLWDDLADADAKKAFRAVVALTGSPRTAVPLLAEQIKPVKGEPRIQKWVADLESDDFSTRRDAFDSLAKVGVLARPALKKALDDKPALEVRKRAEELLERLRTQTLSTDTLRELRAIEVLENLATPEARELLESLAKGAPGPRLTTEAAAALGRLAK